MRWPIEIASCTLQRWLMSTIRLTSGPTASRIILDALDLLRGREPSTAIWVLICR